MRGVLAAVVRAEGLEAVLRHLAEHLEAEAFRLTEGTAAGNPHGHIEGDACRRSAAAVRSALGDVAEALADARAAHRRVAW